MILKITGYVIALILIWVYVYSSCNPRAFDKYELTRYVDDSYRILDTGNVPKKYETINIDQIEYPVVLKPCAINGCTTGVQICRCRADVDHYVRNFDFSLRNYIIVQPLMRGREIAVSYLRWPHQTHGKILSAVETATNDPLLPPRLAE